MADGIIMLKHAIQAINKLEVEDLMTPTLTVFTPTYNRAYTLYICVMKV